MRLLLPAATMGQMISQVKDQIKDPEAKAKADDMLNAVFALARTELDLFYAKITNGNYDTKLIEIEKVLLKEDFIYAVTTEKPATVTDTIKTVGSDFATGHTAEGVGKIIDKAFSTILGETKASKQTKDTYAITAGDLGNVNRLDVMVFQYNFSSKSLIENTTAVKACLVVKSVAKIDDLTDNGLRGIVDQTYASSKKEEKRAIYEEIHTAWKAAKDHV